MRHDVRDVDAARREKPAIAYPPPAPYALQGISNAALARAVQRHGGAGLRPGADAQRVLQRKGPDADKTTDPPQPDLGRSGPHALEYAFKQKIGDRASVSFKLTFNPTEHKTARHEQFGKPDDTLKGSAGFWESKLARERAGGQAATKITQALGRAVGSIDTPIPGLIIEAQAKAFEAQLDAAKNETDINLITVSLALKGDITAWMSDIAGVPAAELGKWKIYAAGEAKIAPSLADLARVRDIWKAKREMQASAEAIKAAAERADVVQKELTAAKSRVDTLRKELRDFEHYGKKQKKLYATRRAFNEAKAAKQALLKQERAALATLKTEKTALTQTLKSRTAALEKARGVLKKAATGLKSKAGRLLGERLAKEAAQRVARLLTKVIPIVNILSTLWDLKEIAVAIYKLSQGAEPGEGGDEGGEAGQGAQSGQGGGTGDAGDAGGAGQDAGDSGGDAGATTVPAEGGTPADAGAPAAGVPDSAPPAGAPPQPAATGLNPNAKALADGLKGDKVKLDDAMAEHLNFAVPAQLTTDQVAELRKRIQARVGGKQQDPYELIGMIQEEAERILRGGPEHVETWVDGQRRPDLDAAALPVDPGEAKPAPQVGAPAPQGKAPAKAPAESKPGPKRPAARGKPPTSLLPAGFPSVIMWDEQRGEYVWRPDGENQLYAETFVLSDGLKVGVTRAAMVSDRQGKFVLATFGLEVQVDEVPAGARPDYPWKRGDKRTYALRFMRDVDTGAEREIRQDTTTHNAFEAALERRNGAYALKRKGAVIETPAAKLRLDGLAGQSQQGSGDDAVAMVGFVVTPVALKAKDAATVDATGTVIRFALGTTVTVQLVVGGKP